ncbi:Hypothetical protein ORPV_919 [Orpheovirus IHUMI-LCC2]|uniref:Uncharacterized protein n=1 Tax=Orpheovirus IHUMI-LCC2 TaxID=2023057 RepID=A0A2I2L5L5_9VIRU|nr:Hypothetical protein ORPV_919 [Orpheovirus IHUMI-LCC2]SNW62823.1 Hypothetical protein ORPV_919 [Orpheovirus IHUMI-LCC2]
MSYEETDDYNEYQEQDEYPEYNDDDIDDNYYEDEGPIATSNTSNLFNGIRIPNISENAGIKAESDLAYNESLYADAMKDIRATMKKDRTSINKMLIDIYGMIPDTIVEDDLTPQERRLLNSERYGGLNPSQQNQLNMIKERMERKRREVDRYAEGGCVNFTQEDEDKLNENAVLLKIEVPGMRSTVCFNLEDLISEGHINTKHKLGYGSLRIGDNVYKYPLTKEEVDGIVDYALTVGIRIPENTEYPTLDMTTNEILRIKREYMI